MRGRFVSNIFSRLAVVRCCITSSMLAAAVGLRIRRAHTGSGYFCGSPHPAVDMHS
jgi:hypothetical protein